MCPKMVCAKSSSLHTVETAKNEIILNFLVGIRTMWPQWKQNIVTHFVCVFFLGLRENPPEMTYMNRNQLPCLHAQWDF